MYWKDENKEKETGKDPLKENIFLEELLWQASYGLTI